MRRLLLATLLLLLMVIPAVPAGAGGDITAVGAQPVLTGLAFPAAFTFAPDGRIFYGERFTGEIRIYDPGSGSDTLFATVPNLSTSGEQGLLGLALHPGYPTSARVYVYATRQAGGSTRNQILVYRDSGGTGVAPRVIFSSDTVSGAYHDGGRILFGPDRMLYAVVGEAHSPANAQDLTNNAGKVLRMTAMGQPPADNPFPQSRIWSYGLRNSYGFDFDPLTDNLWESENGPSCNDEINVIFGGGNYAWGLSQTCSTPPPAPENTNQDGPDPILPATWYTPTTAPTGVAFCEGCDLTSAEGHVFVGEWNTGRIRNLTLTADRLDVAADVVAYDHPSGVLSLEAGTDGTLYFSDASGIWRLIN